MVEIRHLNRHSCLISSLEECVVTGYSDSLGLPTDGVLIETKVDINKVKHDHYPMKPEVGVLSVYVSMYISHLGKQEFYK